MHCRGSLDLGYVCPTEGIDQGEPRRATAPHGCYLARAHPAQPLVNRPWSANPSQKPSPRKKHRSNTRRNPFNKPCPTLPLRYSRLATPCIILCSATARSKASERTSSPSHLTRTSRR